MMSDSNLAIADQNEPEITLYRFMPLKSTIFDPVNLPIYLLTYSRVSICEQVGNYLSNDFNPI